MILIHQHVVASTVISSHGTLQGTSILQQSKQNKAQESPDIHDCPLSKIDATAPMLHGYQTYAPFHDTSMDQEITMSAQRMPMTIYLEILEIPCPKIVFLSLPQCPPDGLITLYFNLDLNNLCNLHNMHTLFIKLSTI
jgi:hypothetical protein